MTQKSPHSETREIEVFRPGTFKPMVGDAITFSAEDLKSLAEGYDVTAPAPAVVGHPKIDAPAYGWARAFRYDEANDRLLAELGEIEPAFADAVAAGRYKKISLELFSPAAPNNPKPGKWYPKHIGFLGAAAPAVSGLKPVSFAEGGEGIFTFEFADATALRDVAGLFRTLREFIIEKFGSEAADKAVPSWSINWIDEAADREPGRVGLPFSEPEKEPAMADKTEGAKPVDQAALDARLADIERRERELRARDHASFAEGLVSEGRLLPVSKAKVVALLDELAAAPPLTVSFADGDQTKTGDAVAMVREILAAQPKVVSFGEIDMGERPEAGTVSFALPDGSKADSASLALHQKAVAYQTAHPSIDYMAAVAAVQR